MEKLSELKGLGPKSERCLNEIGIHTKEQLERVGAVRAYFKLKNECSINPGLNFLGLRGFVWVKNSNELMHYPVMIVDSPML